MDNYFNDLDLNACIFIYFYKKYIKILAHWFPIEQIKVFSSWKPPHSTLFWPGWHKFKHFTSAILALRLIFVK